MGFAQKNQDLDPRPEISIGHMGLAVRDVKATHAFFKLVGARTVVRLPGMVALELRGGTHLILRSDNSAAPAQAGFDLMVDDISEMHRRLAKAGYVPSNITRGGVHRSFEVKGPSRVILQFTSSHAIGPV